MHCVSCSRRTLGLFIQSFMHTELRNGPRLRPLCSLQASRFSSAPRRSHDPEEILLERPDPRSGASQHPKAACSSSRSSPPKVDSVQRKKKESWQIQKAAVKEKLGGEAWNPRKKLSPDTMEGIRHLHNTQPQRFTTAVLAQHFKVSPDAIRRILKSKWRPSDEEHEERLRRWDKRGEKIWSNLVELGVKPPKRWREMGVGRASPGQRPKWKSMSKNTVPVQDSAPEDAFEASIIPIVDGRTGEGRPSQLQHTSLAERLL